MNGVERKVNSVGWLGTLIKDFPEKQDPGMGLLGGGGSGGQRKNNATVIDF